MNANSTPGRAPESRPPRQPSYRELKRLIFGLFLLIFLMLTLFSAIVLGLEYQRAISSARTRIKGHAQAAIEHTRRIVEGVDLALQQVVGDTRRDSSLRKRSPEEIHEALQQLVGQLPQIRAIIVLDPAGISIQDSSVPIARRVDLSDRDYFRVHRDDLVKNLFVGLPLKGRTSGMWFLAMSRRIDGGGGRLAGVAAAVVEPVYFEKFYDVLGERDNLATLLLHHDGTVIAASKSHPHKGGSAIGSSLAGTSLYRRIQESSSGSAGTFSGKLLEDGKKYFAFASVIGKTDFSGARLTQVTLVSEANALSPFRRHRKTLLFFYGTTLLLLCGCCLYMIRQVSGRQVAEQKMNLAHLKRMEAERGIETMYATLEQRVDERTASLRASMEALRNSREHLVQSEKMASLGGLVAGVAHEINTPVGICVTETSFLEEKTLNMMERHQAGGITRSEFDGYLDTVLAGSRGIATSMNHAANLVASFKQVAVDQSGEIAGEFRLQPLITGLVSDLKRECPDVRHAIEVECPGKMVINSYPGAFSKTLSSLLENAILHGFDGASEGEIRIGVNSTGNGISLRIADNGKGIAPENIDRVFDPFFTTRRGSGGTGLGLHIVYNLVTQKLGGQISCESRKGAGTEFCISIPLHQSEE